MRIFISQSGERSKTLAHELQELVRLLVNDADPWVSDNGIDKGTRSLSVIAETLESSEAGIICLTSDNLNAPWILFESGALSRRQRDHVWTVLLDIKNEQVTPPLGQFQHSAADHDGIFAVVQSINKLSPKPRTETDLKTIFEALWPTYAPRIDAIVKTPAPTGTPARRDPEEISLEALSTSRELLDRVDRIASRTEDAILLVGELVKAMVPPTPPSFLDFLIHESPPAKSDWANRVLLDWKNRPRQDKYIDATNALLDLLQEKAKGTKSEGKAEKEGDGTPDNGDDEEKE
jgi:hypothetical protein